MDFALLPPESAPPDVLALGQDVLAAAGSWDRAGRRVGLSEAYGSVLSGRACCIGVDPMADRSKRRRPSIGGCARPPKDTANNLIQARAAALAFERKHTQ